MRLGKWRAGRAARLLFWAAAAIVFVLAVIPHPAVPGEPNDKVEHMAAFAALGLLGSFAYPGLALVQLLLRLSVFGGAIEIVQGLPFVHRDSDVLDWVADTVAVAVVVLLVRWWRSRR